MEKFSLAEGSALIPQDSERYRFRTYAKGYATTKIFNVHKDRWIGMPLLVLMCNDLAELRMESLTPEDAHSSDYVSRLETVRSILSQIISQTNARARSDRKTLNGGVRFYYRLHEESFSKFWALVVCTGIACKMKPRISPALGTSLGDLETYVR